MQVRIFATITHQIAKLTNRSRRDKTGLNHAAHEQIANPLSILAIGFIPLPWSGILWMREDYVTTFFEDVEDRNPIFTGGFHTNILTGIFGEPGG